VGGPTDGLLGWVRRLGAETGSERAAVAAEAVAGGLLDYVPDLVELFARARGRERMPYGTALAALVEAAPAAERRSRLRAARALEKLPPLLHEENSLVVVAALALLEAAGDLSLVPQLLAVRVPAAAGYATRAIRTLVLDAGDAGLELARELAGSADAHTRRVGLGLLESAAAAGQRARMAAGNEALAGVVAGLQADDRPLMRTAVAVVMGSLEQVDRGPALVEAALRHADVLVRREALRALVALRPPDVYRCCVAALEDGDPHVAEMAAAALCDGDPAEVLDAVGRALLEGGATPPLAALVAMLPALESVDLQALLLQDTDALVRRRAGGKSTPTASEERLRRTAQRAVLFDGPLGGLARATLWHLAGSQGWTWPRTLVDVELLLRGLEDPAPAAREAARALLFRELRPVSPAAVTLALSAMARLPDGEELLVRAAVELQDEVSRQARRALALRLGLPPEGHDARLIGVASWVDLLRSGAPERQAFAARVLGRFGCNDAAPALERALLDADPAVCMAAAEALVELGLARSVAALMEALDRRPRDEKGRGPEAHARQRLVAALGGMGGLPALRFLVERGGDTDGDHDAVAALGRRLGPSAYDALLELVGSEGEASRRLALVALGATGDERAVEVLQAWRSEPSFMKVAVRALGETRHPAAVRPLIAVLRALVGKDGREVRAVHRELARALEAVMAVASASMDELLLGRLANMETVSVGVWRGDVHFQDRISYAAVRRLAGDELERRGRPRLSPGRPGTITLERPPIEGGAPVPEVPFLRLPHLLRPCPCGEVPLPAGPADGQWVLACCSRGHAVRYRAAYVSLVRPA
jgi:HEAT repeat protein